MRHAGALWAGSLLLAGAPLALAAGGTLQDQAVSLVYSSGHWSGAPNAALHGTDASGANPLFRSGWWYRVDGVDTREYPFPPPDSESYGSDGKLLATWSNVGGKGFSAQESTWVFDDEGPSGGFVSQVSVDWGSNPGHNITLFHFLDVDVAGTFGNDSAVLRGPGFIKISDGAATIRYVGNYVRHYMVAPYDNLNGGEIKRRLNDTAVDDLADTGLPFGPGDVTAGFQFLTFNGGWNRVMVSSNQAHDYVRGMSSFLGPTPALYFRSNVSPSHSGLGVYRRTRLMESWSGYAAGSEILAENDFDGDANAELLFRNLSTGALSIGGATLVGAAPPPANWQLAATTDFDGDGRADILWRNTTSQKLVIWLMNGPTRVAGRIPSPDQAADANWTVVGSGDFDNDALPDLIFYNQTSGKLVIWYLDANQVRRTGAFTDPASVGSNAWRAVSVGDYGRGSAGPSGPAPWGSPDIVWQNDVSRKLVVWHMDFAGRRVSGTFTTPDCTGCTAVFGPR